MFKINDIVTHKVTRNRVLIAFSQCDDQDEAFYGYRNITVNDKESNYKLNLQNVTDFENSFYSSNDPMNYPDGFYWLRNKDNSEEPCLVKIYQFLDYSVNPEGIIRRGYGMGIWDGGGFHDFSDILPNSEFIPINISLNK
jgi:hypothetical protein